MRQQQQKKKAKISTQTIFKALKVPGADIIAQ